MITLARFQTVNDRSLHSQWWINFIEYLKLKSAYDLSAEKLINDELKLYGADDFEVGKRTISFETEEDMLLFLMKFS